MTRFHRQASRRGGFSLLELLIVISIIAFLASMSVVMYANFVERSRVTATASTILKIHEQLNQRMSQFYEHFEKDLVGRKWDSEINKKIAQLALAGVLDVSDQAAEILVRKDRFRQLFPQRYAETNRIAPTITVLPPAPDAHPGDLGPDGQPGAAGSDDDGNGITDDLIELGWPGTDDLPQTAESAELLYFILTGGEVFGIPPVDDDAFNTNEIGDTDGDGRMEFIDAWGEPLRFYRWPTRLIRPRGPGTAVNRDVADLLIKGLPARPSTGRDPLDEDPDDAVGVLATHLPSLSGEVNEGTYHTIDTYHVPLIVSTGENKLLGLFEPNDAANLGTLAQVTTGPDGQPGVASVDDDGVNGVDDIGELGWPGSDEADELTDNITNRNQRAGGI